MFHSKFVVSILAICLLVSACNDSKSKKGGSNGPSGIPQDISFKPQAGNGLTDAELQSVVDTLKAIAEANRADITGDLHDLLVTDHDDYDARKENEDKIRDFSPEQKQQYDEAARNCEILEITEEVTPTGKEGKVGSGTITKSSGGLSGSRCPVQSSTNTVITTKVTKLKLGEYGSYESMQMSIQGKTDTRNRRTSVNGLNDGQFISMHSTTEMSGIYSQTESGTSATYMTAKVSVVAEVFGQGDLQVKGEMKNLSRSNEVKSSVKMVFQGDAKFMGRSFKVSALIEGSGDQEIQAQVYVNGRKIDPSVLKDLGNPARESISF